jgi:tetratricopeptide (TPR) repeat protein
MPFVGRSTLYDVIDVAHALGRPPRRAAVLLEASRALARRGDRYHQLTPRMPLHPGSSFVLGVLKLMVQIAEALAHAHERGVLHGDLKPSNVVMSVSGVPLLVDFNLSHSHNANNLLTGGTLPYMAPEQIQAMLEIAPESSRVDQRSDIFSFGALLFELLTGQLPFGGYAQEAQSVAASGRMLDAQANGAASLRERLDGLDQDLTELVLSCLAFDPADRPQDAGQVVRALRDQLCWSGNLRRAVRRHPLLPAGMTMACGAGLLASALWWAHQPPLPERHYQRAVTAYQDRDFASALEALNQAITADPQYAQAYLARGCAAIQCYQHDKFKGWLDSAFRDFTQAIRFGAGAAAEQASAYCLIRNDEYAVAASALEELDRRGRLTAADANNLAYCYEKLSVGAGGSQHETENLMASADKHLRLAISMAPELIEPYINLAIVELARYRFTNGDYLPSDGLKAVRKAISLGSSETSTYFFASRLAGVMAQELNDPTLLDECLGYLEKAVEQGHSLQRDTLNGDAIYDKLLDHPRFQVLLARNVDGSRRTSASRVIEPAVISSPFFLASDSVSLRKRLDTNLP